jgi:hypothetical protein
VNSSRFLVCRTTAADSDAKGGPNISTPQRSDGVCIVGLHLLQRKSHCVGHPYCTLVVREENWMCAINIRPNSDRTLNMHHNGLSFLILILSTNSYNACSIPQVLHSTMPRLSRRFSRYFSLRSRSSGTTTPTTSRITKNLISKPIIANTEEDLQSLTAARTPPTPGSTYSPQSSPDLGAHEHRNWDNEDRYSEIDIDIDDILAQYGYKEPIRDDTTEINVAMQIEAAPATTAVHSPTTIKRSRIEVFNHTPPPAPSWDKVSFGRQTRLFGPGEAARQGRKDWRGEFGKRGYAVL